MVKRIIFTLMIVCSINFAQTVVGGIDENGNTQEISTDTDGNVNVNIQDQTSTPFHRYFMTEDDTTISLVSAVAMDDTSLILSTGHGFTAGGEYVLINYGDYFQQNKVMTVSDDTISIESPVGINLPIIGTQIIRGTIEMNINGSITPDTFYCRIGNNSQPVDIKHLHVFIRDASDGDQAKYGGLTALTNGLFMRMQNFYGQNLGVYKTNSSFIEFGGIPYYDTKAPSGEYSFDFSFDLLETYGVVFRLEANSKYIMAVVNDNLTGLTYHRITATGQITVGEN